MRYLAFTLSSDFQFIRIVVDDVFYLCFHILDNLMVQKLSPPRKEVCNMQLITIIILTT